MSPETSSVSDRNEFLLSYFHDEFLNPNPKWQEVETHYALWRFVAINSDGKKILAVRTSEIGKIDSYCIDLDNPHDFAHVEVDGGSSFFEVLEGIQAQAEMGLTVPNQDEVNQFDELVDLLRLFESIN